MDHPRRETLHARIATHPGIIPRPLLPAEALSDMTALLHLLQMHVIGEGLEGHAFRREYIEASEAIPLRATHVSRRDVTFPASISIPSPGRSGITIAPPCGANVCTWKCCATGW